MSILRLTNICKQYPDGNSHINQVLNGLNLEVQKGDFIAVTGASGSGKTTLLSILGTLLPFDQGSYLLENTELNANSTDLSRIRNQKIGFVFQDNRLLPQYSALENILLPTLAFKGKSSAEEIQYAQELMKLTQIEHIANQYPETLSGGEASRVAVCRALIMKPSLLLADEPTGQLDAENSDKIARLLADLNSTLQTTIVLVTHSEKTAQAASKTFILKNGILE